MLFVVFNVVILLGSFYLTLMSIINYQLVLALPVPLIIVYVIGLITPVLNVKDTIRNLVILSESNKDEDSM